MLPTAADLGMGVVHLPGGQEVWVRKASYASQASASRSMAPEVAAMTANSQTLGPGETWPAAHPEEVEPRRFNYPVGFNIRTQPRSTEPISFEMLEALANNYDVLRLAIEHRKSEMRGLEYVVQPKPVRGMKRDAAKARAQELDPSIDAAMAFFAKPNQEDFWAVWLGQWLENLFVADAPTIYRRRRRDGGLYGADIVEGSTIRPIIDAYGRVPLPPDAAYGQVLFGQTWGLYTTDDLLYTPYWQRPKSPYGHPPAEWILLAINRALRRQSIDLTTYTEGTMPAAFYRVPEQWSGSQIGELQTLFDGILAGNDTQRSRVRFVPGGAGTGLDQVHPEPKTEVEEWLLYLTCAAVGVQPTDIGFQPRGSGLGGKGFSDAQQDAKTAVSTKPLAMHVKGVCDEILNDWLGMPELEIVFPELDKSEDIAKRAAADEIYVNIGKVSVDELRERDDQDPIGLGAYVTGTVTLVDDILNPPAPPAGPPIDPVTGLPLALPPAGPADQKLLADGKPDPNAAQPPAGDAIAKIAGELGAWERKAIKAVRSGRPALVQFTTDVVPAELGAAVDRYLAKVSTVAGVRDAFRLAKAGAPADPFVPSSSASSAISGPAISATRPDASATGWLSGRRPYP